MKKPVTASEVREQLKKLTLGTAFPDTQMRQYLDEKDIYMRSFTSSLQLRCHATTHEPSHGLIRCSLETGHSGEHLGKGVKWTLPTLGEVTKSSKALVGWRAWDLTRTIALGVLLKSLSADVNWETPRMTTREGDRVRNTIFGSYKSGDYGIYSYKDPMLMFKGLGLEFAFYPVLGRIDNLGHIIEHELGWRSQIAVVRELWVIPERLERSVSDINTARAIKDLEDRYKCQVNKLSAKQVKGWARWYTEDKHPTVRDRHEHR